MPGHTCKFAVRLDISRQSVAWWLPYYTQDRLPHNFPLLARLSHSSPGISWGCGLLAVNTRAINPSRSSSAWKCMTSPDLTCSTRPAQCPCAMSAVADTCTTKARCAGNGRSVLAGGFTCSSSHAIVRLCSLSHENIGRGGARSPQERHGFLTDFSPISHRFHRDSQGGPYAGRSLQAG